MADRFIWTPPSIVRAEAEAARHELSRFYQRRSLVTAGEPVQLSPKAATRELLRGVLALFPQATSLGMQRPGSRQIPDARGRRDPHHMGIAADIGCRGAYGATIANWLVYNARQLQLQYVLFSELECSFSNIGAVWEPYTVSGTASDTTRHADHVHVEINSVAASWPAGEMARRVSEAAQRFPPL